MVETGQASDISFHSLHHLKRCPTTQDSGPQPKVHVRHTTGTMYGADQCTISSCHGSHSLEKSLSYNILEKSLSYEILEKSLNFFISVFLYESCLCTLFKKIKAAN